MFQAGQSEDVQKRFILTRSKTRGLREPNINTKWTSAENKVSDKNEQNNTGTRETNQQKNHLHMNNTN